MSISSCLERIENRFLPKVDPPPVKVTELVSPKDHRYPATAMSQRADATHELPEAPQAFPKERAIEIFTAHPMQSPKYELAALALGINHALETPEATNENASMQRLSPERRKTALQARQKIVDAQLRQSKPFDPNPTPTHSESTSSSPYTHRELAWDRSLTAIVATDTVRRIQVPRLPVLKETKRRVLVAV